MTNRARLWYVPVSAAEKVLPVPPMPYKSSEQEALGRDVYEEQKASRSTDQPPSFQRQSPGTGKSIDNDHIASALGASSHTCVVFLLSPFLAVTFFCVFNLIIASIKWTAATGVPLLIKHIFLIACLRSL